MYSRTISRRHEDGSAVRCMRLAHNQWDVVGQQVTAQVIHSFGREDQLDREALKRLIRSLARWLDPEDALRAAAREDFWFLDSRPLGGGWVLDHLSLDDMHTSSRDGPILPLG